MSKEGWQGFLVAEGVDAWVVLHGGATAVFKLGSIGEAARLAAAMAEIDGFEGSGALLTIVDASLTVRLTRDLWQLESRHIDLARAVSEVASAHGAVADRASVQEVQLRSPQCQMPRTSALRWNSVESNMGASFLQIDG